MSDEKQEKETEEDKKEETTAKSSKGDNFQTSDIVKQAVEARQGLAAENERLEKNLAELRELTARNLLGGESEAVGTSDKPKEIDPVSYANEVLAGKYNK